MAGDMKTLSVRESLIVGELDDETVEMIEAARYGEVPAQASFSETRDVNSAETAPKSELK